MSKVRQSQNELDSFLADLDEDVEGMQSTILFLQQELRKTKETSQVLQKENAGLKVAMNGRSNGDSSGAREPNRTDSESEEQPEDNDRTSCGGVKRVRRSSVLSIDYHDDDLNINTNGDIAMTSDPE